jgi:hypothetical protein
LPSDATEDDHLALLGLLNSSTACFWMKQVFHNKGSTVDDRGARQTTVAFENFYEFTGTGLQKFPVTEIKPLNFATELDRLSRKRQIHLPAQLSEHFPLSRTALDDHQAKAAALLGSMIALQEELDWRCYTLYGLTDQDLCYRAADGEPLTPPEIQLGQRAFEIVMARKMAAGELQTTWFERHRSAPITELPDHWPDDYKRLVERRMALIEGDKFINLIEQPEYKRRWNLEPWDEQEKRALRNWLLNRLEGETYWPEPHMQTTRTLADKAQRDADFMQVAECYRGHAGFDVHTLVAELVEAESVPFLPILRYKPSGLRKRDIWEHTWAQQRQEDAIDADVAASLARGQDETEAQFQTRLTAAQRRRKQDEIGDIPPPPKYRFHGLSQRHLLALTRPTRRAQRAVYQLSLLLPRCGPDAGDRLGWLGSPATGSGPGRVVHRGGGTGRLAARTPEAAAARPCRAYAMAQTVAQRHRSHLQRTHGGVL